MLRRLWEEGADEAEAELPPCPAPALARPLHILAPLRGACCVGSSQPLSFSPVGPRARTSETQDRVRTEDGEGQTWGTHESGFLAVESRCMAMSQDDIGT